MPEPLKDSDKVGIELNEPCPPLCHLKSHLIIDVLNGKLAVTQRNSIEDMEK